jgi:hypothetical protein
MQMQNTKDIIKKNKTPRNLRVVTFKAGGQLGVLPLYPYYHFLPGGANFTGHRRRPAGEY